MDITYLQKMIVLPMLVLFLIVGGCSGKKKSADSEEANLKNQLTDTEKNSFTHPALDFTLNRIDDTEIRLTDFLGHKIVLINVKRSVRITKTVLTV